MGLTDEKCILLTTYRKSGAPVATPVWLADIGNGEAGFWTSSESGKVKRLRHTQRVTVQPCNSRGVPSPGSEPVETTARIITGAEYEAMRQKIVAKYGFMTKITKVLASLVWALQRKPKPYGDIGIAIRLTAAQ